MSGIYLDHNATSPLHPEVVEAMTEVLRDHPGNPSSTHGPGREARARVERARAQVAALVGAEPPEIVFTGSATEANNAAIHAAVERAGAEAHVVTTEVEHPSVVEPLAWLEARGLRVTRIGVDAEGRVDPEAVAAAVRPETALVAVILANNETGVLQDMDALRQAVGTAPLHVDATQAVGKIPVDMGTLGAASLAGSAHKFNGPKGTGFLVWRGAGTPVFVRGGPQERRRRGGTENVAGIVGIGVAAELAARELSARGERCRMLRDRLWHGIEATIPDVRRNGSASHVLPNTLNLEFVETAGDVLLEALDGEGICVSAGAACASGSIEPSPVLSAMGRSPEQARGSLRLSVGQGNDEAQIDRVLAVLPELVTRVRRIAA